MCLSGINALYIADQMIQAGDAEVVVAGGMESMTNAPYLLPKARAGYRMGNGELLDSLIHDGLWCAFDAMHMGEGTDQYHVDLARELGHLGAQLVQMWGHEMDHTLQPHRQLAHGRWRPDGEGGKELAGQFHGLLKSFPMA